MNEKEEELEKKETFRSKRVTEEMCKCYEHKMNRYIMRLLPFEVKWALASLPNEWNQIENYVSILSLFGKQRRWHDAEETKWNERSKRRRNERSNKQMFVCLLLLL